MFLLIYAVFGGSAFERDHLSGFGVVEVSLSFLSKFGERKLEETVVGGCGHLILGNVLSTIGFLNHFLVVLVVQGSLRRPTIFEAIVY